MLHILGPLWFLVWGGLVCFARNYCVIIFHFFFDLLCVLSATGQEKDQDTATGGKGGPSGKNGKGKTPPKAQISLLNKHFVSTDVCWYHCWKPLPQIASGGLGFLSPSFNSISSFCLLRAGHDLGRSFHLDLIWTRERESRIGKQRQGTASRQTGVNGQFHSLCRSIL